MKPQSNATPVSPVTLPSVATAPDVLGLGYCALGVLGFSFTFPATRLAVTELGAAWLCVGRGAIAGLLALAVLLWRREPLPKRSALPSLCVVALGAVIGFPALSALALRVVPAHHGVLISGIVPFFTALFATVRNGERVSRMYWGSAFLGMSLVLGFGWLVHPAPPSMADLWLILAAISAAWAYAEGARLAREFGGYRVISWALVLALPVTGTGLSTLLCFTGLPEVSSKAWLGLAYVSVVSMFLAFIAWYRGLALAPVTVGSQLQLAQPALGVLWSALLLREPISAWTILELLLIVALLVGSRRNRPSTPRRATPL